MRSGAVLLAIWSLWLGLLALVLWIWTSDDLAPALLTGAAVGWGVLAVVAAARGGREPARRVIARSSAPTVVIAFGIAIALNGLSFGLWLILIGAEVVALGLAALVRDLLAARREAAP